MAKDRTATGITVITRTPVRLSFGGGGTDLASYYEEFGGFVLSTTIDKYFHSKIRTSSEQGVLITSSDLKVSRKYGASDILRTGQAACRDSLDPLILPLTVIRFLKIVSARISLSSEIQQGSGLGLSGAVTVNLLHGLLAIQGKNPGPEMLAGLASRIEIDILKRPIGLQDQYACAFGGLNAMTFSKDGARVERLRLKKGTLETFQKNLLLFFTGRCRDSAVILKAQTKNTAARRSAVLESLHRIKELGLKMKNALLCDRPDEVGLLLHQSWQNKKRLAGGISLPFIEEAYEAALKNGALGGKITGAGGGGYLLFYCPKTRQAPVRKALKKQGLRELPFRFDKEGSRAFVR